MYIRSRKCNTSVVHGYCCLQRGVAGENRDTRQFSKCAIGVGVAAVTLTHSLWFGPGFEPVLRTEVAKVVSKGFQGLDAFAPFAPFAPAPGTLEELSSLSLFFVAVD